MPISLWRRIVESGVSNPQVEFLIDGLPHAIDAVGVGDVTKRSWLERVTVFRTTLRPASTRLLADDNCEFGLANVVNHKWYFHCPNKMSNVEQRPYVPAKKVNTEYPVSCLPLYARKYPANPSPQAHRFRSVCIHSNPIQDH